jgi:hypothetical protein
VDRSLVVAWQEVASIWCGRTATAPAAPLDESNTLTGMGAVGVKAG